MIGRGGVLSFPCSGRCWREYQVRYEFCFHLLNLFPQIRWVFCATSPGSGNAVSLIQHCGSLVESRPPSKRPMTPPNRDRNCASRSEYRSCARCCILHIGDRVSLLCLGARSGARTRRRNSSVMNYGRRIRWRFRGGGGICCCILRRASL